MPWVGPLVLAAVVALTGCGTSQTSLVTANFTNAQAGDVLLRAMALVMTPTDRDAALVGVLVNDGATDDVLTTVRIEPTAPASSGSTATAGANLIGPVTVTPNLVLPADESTEVGGPDNATVRIPSLSLAAARQLGTFVTATLTFRDAGPIRVELQVADAVNYFTEYAPTPTANPAARPDGSHSP